MLAQAVSGYMAVGVLYSFLDIVVVARLPYRRLWRSPGGRTSYRGKPAVRYFREGDGDVGIIRSPVRAIALPDRLGLTIPPSVLLQSTG